ncbi:MAG TPA: YbhN family protein [Acidimicrobiales bacterium]|nr:YbhN family protein [Acidimicrobiales bacterium]
MKGGARRSVRRALYVLAFLLVLEYLVLPQIAGARHALQVLGQVRPAWLVAGVALEALAVACYAQLTRSLIPAPSRPGFATASRITLSTLGASHVVPGGAAVGASLGYRLLTSEGVSGPDTAFALATQGLGSAVVLNMLLWFGLVGSIPAHGFNPLYVTAAILGALLLGGVAVAVALATRGEDRMVALVCRAAGHLPFLDGPALGEALRRIAGRLRTLLDDRPLLWRATGWAAANWLLDAASLWVFVRAFGGRPGPAGLLVSFGLANVLAAIPITPGGLGVVEATLTALLVGFGVPRGEAVIGVVTYRLANFWLPIPLGAAAYVSLTVGRLRDQRRAREALRVATATAAAEAPTRREWARAHAITAGDRRSSTPPSRVDHDDDPT